jgi:hypothetical protein
MAGLHVGAFRLSPAPARIPIWRPETRNTKIFHKIYITNSISTVLHQLGTNFQRLSRVFGVGNSSGAIGVIIRRNRMLEIQGKVGLLF